jgi:hypothetical protein
MTSCTYDMPRSACSVALETYHDAVDKVNSGCFTVPDRGSYSCSAVYIYTVPTLHECNLHFVMGRYVICLLLSLLDNLHCLYLTGGE